MFYRLFVLSFIVACASLFILAKMRLTSLSTALYFASNSNASAAQCNASTSVDLTWHPPNSTVVNSLTSVINGTGIYGYTFNSSNTPAGLPYDTYNWCNMPHVRAQEYPMAPSGYKLEYVELV